MFEWLSGPQADPGRLHAEGLRAREAVEVSREAVAELFGARPREVVFTSGATESINAATWGATGRGSHVVCPVVEHAAVRESSSAHEVSTVGVDESGVVDLGALEAAITERTALVHLQWANHELATIQPVEAAVQLCRQRGVLLHVDAASAAGHVPIDFDSSGVDLMSISSHKLGGPTGVGTLLVRRGLRLRQMILGSDQERARRAGLENVAAILGFATACDELTMTLAEEAATQHRLLDRLRNAVRGWQGVTVLGGSHRVPHIVCLAVDGVEPQAVVLGLDRRGVAVHSGSACASEGLEPSPILEAIGADAHRSLRVSVGWNSTEDDISAVIHEVPVVVDQLRDLADHG